MATGARIQTVCSPEESEGVPVRPFAETPKVERSDYSDKGLFLEGGPPTSSLNQGPNSSAVFDPGD